MTVGRNRDNNLWEAGDEIIPFISGLPWWFGVVYIFTCPLHQKCSTLRWGRLVFGHLKLYLVPNFLALTGADEMGPGQQAYLSFLSWCSGKILDEKQGRKDWVGLQLQFMVHYWRGVKVAGIWSTLLHPQSRCEINAHYCSVSRAFPFGLGQAQEAGTIHI